MAVTECPGGQWTTIPDTGGAMLLRGSCGMFVSTDGTTPADFRGVHALGSTESMVIEAGLVVNVWPASLHGCTAASQPV